MISTTSFAVILMTQALSRAKQLGVCLKFTSGVMAYILTSLALIEEGRSEERRTESRVNVT